MHGKTENSPFITKAAAARLSGLSRRYIYELIDLGIIAVDARGKIFRGPFLAWVAQRNGGSADGQE